MIFITGDIHGNYDIKKLNSDNFPEQKQLTAGDYLIICGDFGLVWDDSPEELYWRKWLSDKPWTTLWIDGNHENFDLLKRYPEEEWHGGMIQKITDKIFHLCRGYVFHIDGKKIFAFGGAESHDKERRKLGESLWEEELPSEEEMARGRQSLAAAGNSVDIIITHSLFTSIQQYLFEDYGHTANVLTDYLEELNAFVDFKLWFSGHYHRSLSINGRHHLIYNDIVKLTDNGFETVHSEKFMEVL